VISGGGFSKLATDLQFPFAVETGPDGTVYAMEISARHISFFPGGLGPGLMLEHNWMSFSPSSDLTFDNDTGILYVNNFSPSGLYALHQGGSFKRLESAPGSIFCHDIIAIPEPPGVWLFVASVVSACLTILLCKRQESGFSCVNDSNN
jgi:hypothetical protein